MSSIAGPARSTDERGGRRVRSRWRSSRIELIAYRVLVILGALAVWQAFAEFRVVNPFWISKPTSIVTGLWTFLQTSDGWSQIWVTTYEAASGLALGAVLGIVSAFLLTRWQTAQRVMNPFVTVLNSVPRLALTPLFIIWFGVGSLSKVMMVFTLVYFIVLVNTVGGIESVDDDLKVVARLLGADRWRVVRSIVIPSSVPWILAALRVGLGNAFAGTVVAEMIAGQGGLGFFVSYSAGVLDLTSVFVAVFLVMALAYLADLALLKVERRLLRWRPTGLAAETR